MKISRGEFLRLGLAGGVTLAFGGTACSGEVLTGTLLPSKAKLPEPFEVPLPVPPVLEPVRTGAGADYYEMAQRAGRVEILPASTTEVWGYDGIFPGPTIESRRGRPTVVRDRNELPVPDLHAPARRRTPPELRRLPHRPGPAEARVGHDRPARARRDDHGSGPCTPGQGLRLPAGAAGRDALVPRPPHGLHRSRRSGGAWPASTSSATTRRTRCPCRRARRTSR